MDTTDESDPDAPTLALGDINADDATDISTDLGNEVMMMMLGYRHQN